MRHLPPTACLRSTRRLRRLEPAPGIRRSEHRCPITAVLYNCAHSGLAFIQLAISTSAISLLGAEFDGHDPGVCAHSFLGWGLAQFPRPRDASETSVGAWARCIGLAIVDFVVGSCLGAWCKTRLGLWSLVMPRVLRWQHLQSLAAHWLVLGRQSCPVIDARRSRLTLDDGHLAGAGRFALTAIWVWSPRTVKRHEAWPLKFHLDERPAVRSA